MNNLEKKQRIMNTRDTIIQLPPPNIKAYANTHQLEACYVAKQQRSQQQKGSRDILQALRQMSPEPEEKMKKLFNISYNIAKCERPFSDFADLCKRHAKNGLLRNAYTLIAGL